ncbi:MAG: site-specific integrase [Chitinophagaceae bacterium]
MILPEPRFYLKDKNSKEPTLIVMQAKYNGQRIYLSAVEKVNPIDWDFDKQRAIITRRNLANASINIWLDKMTLDFKTIFRNCLLEEIEPTAILITQKLQEKLNLTNTQPLIPIGKETLFLFIEKYIQECSGYKSQSTIKTYQSTFKHLKNYSKLLSKELDFEDITHDFRNKFIRYLQNLGSGKNTEGKHIKEIKVFMNEATERGLNFNLDFRSKSFSKPSESATKVFLSMQEIEKLVDLDLSYCKTKEIVRDYFIISSMSSLRYSDVIDIKEENIKNDAIHIITKKTGEQVIIPLSPWIKNIFIKYNYRFEKKIPCNQIFNKVIKEVCKIAGLNEQITITKTIGGVKKTIVYMKYELISSHSARRSFVSNCILAGIGIPQIQLITGHRSLKTLSLYVRINQVQNAERLANHSFFQ